ncbi:hypothetical protein BHE74_00018425 [Ensete ventricosum]|nr:hypothetical protein BHE74_00018425 [Ensete ventricosum]
MGSRRGGSKVAASRGRRGQWLGAVRDGQLGQMRTIKRGQPLGATRGGTMGSNGRGLGLSSWLRKAEGEAKEVVGSSSEAVVCSEEEGSSNDG